MKLDRQSCLDAACLIVGSAIGASASVAIFLYLFMQKQHHGKPPAAGATGEPQ